MKYWGLPSSVIASSVLTTYGYLAGDHLPGHALTCYLSALLVRHYDVGIGICDYKKTFPQAKKGRFYGAIYMKQQSNLFEFLQLPFQSFSHRFINRCLLIFIKVVPLNKN
jgi:hypothetical protein